MAGQLGSLVQQDFSRGENTVASPYAVLPNQVQQAINLILDEHGSLRTRDGTLKITNASPRPDRVICKLFDFVDTAGTNHRLAMLKGTTLLGNNQIFNPMTVAWTLVGTFSQIYATPDIVTFNNQAIIANGNADFIRACDGVSLSTLTATAPNAAHLAGHLGYLWVGNTNATTTATAGPSSLQSSDLNNAASWPAANQVFVAKDDGSSIQALSLFTIAESGISPTATLIIWKDFSGYEATGVLGAASFALQRIKSDMGCVAPRSVQFISGFGVIRLTHRGFALYDGVNDTLISEEERPRIFGRDNYVGLDWTNIATSMASQVPNPPLYICACPVSGSNGLNQRLFIYDLVRRAWTVSQFATDVGTLQLSLVPGTLPFMMVGDARNGFVRQAFKGDTTDDGTDISWNLLTRAYSGKSPTSRSYFQRMLAAFFNITAGVQVNAGFYFSPTNVVGSKNVTITVPTISQLSQASGWGADLWGSAPWGSSSVSTSLTDQILPFGINAIADSVQVSLSGTGQMKLRALEVQAREKAPTRSAASLVSG